MKRKFNSNNILSLVFVISSVFSSTSIINTSTFGIPLYYVSIVILIIYAIINNSVALPIFAWHLFLIVAFGLVLISIVQGLTLPTIDSKQLTQTVFRIIPLVYFILLFNFCIGNQLSLVPEFLLIMKIIVLYGIYQHFGLAFGLPFSNNFLANNTSFNSINLYDTLSGWNGTLRISAVWSEPAGSAVAMTTFLAFLFNRNNESKYSKVFWMVLAVFFAYWTYSRILWLAFSIVIIVNLFRMIHLQAKAINFLRRWRYVIWVFFASLLVFYLINAMNYSTDLSALSRSQSVLVGWRVFLIHPFQGIGFGNFYQYSFLYSEMFSVFQPMDLILGTFSNYAATLGLVGLIIAVSPVLYLLNGNDKNFILGFSLSCALLTIGMIGSDIYSTSMVWMIIIMWYRCGLEKDEVINEQ
ncbi:O-antigen ligase family protein [Leuconostoc mesenteroides]|uniref:O-antigen ligase family protein n=1 Tax=Leuconostoc mesenteroides TaxID=1245 RepID=UPI000B8D7ABA|nr:O-antigen ligase family protein [Leuconostoc mesenteroides]ASR69473.1 hypothetical protein CBW60_08900 [Leuconostoc mesenteroides]QHM55584.1 hypothetical protein C7M43_00284 [Leuconostoc mesenteroides]